MFSGAMPAMAARSSSTTRALRWPGGDIAVGEIGSHFGVSPLRRFTMAAPARRLQPHEIAWHEAQIGRAGGRDRLVVDGDPTEAAGPATVNALRRKARTSDRKSTRLNSS